MVKKLFWILPAILLMGCGETAPEPPAPGETEAILAELCAPYEEEGLRWESAGDCVVSESGAEQTFTLTYTGAEAFAAGLTDEVEAALAARMEEVTFASELCEEGTYRADVLEEAWETALSARQADPAAYAELTYQRKVFRIKCDMYTTADWNRIKSETKGKNTTSESWIEYHANLKDSFRDELDQAKREYEEAVSQSLPV